jgi:hypothetical protein
MLYLSEERDNNMTTKEKDVTLKQTSQKIASKAGKALSDPKTSATTKSIAASALSQKRSTKK